MNSHSNFLQENHITLCQNNYIKNIIKSVIIIDCDDNGSNALLLLKNLFYVR